MPKPETTHRSQIIDDVLPLFLEVQRTRFNNGDGRSSIHECKAREIISDVYDLLLIRAGSKTMRVIK